MMGYSPKSLEALYANRKPLLAALSTLAINEVIIRYSGGGDSGDVTEVSVLPKEVALEVAQSLAQQQIDYHCLAGEERDEQYHYYLEVQAMSIDAALRDFTLTWVDAHHGGWENSEGGAGFVTINVAKSSFCLDHVEYYTESTGYEHRL